MKYNQMSLFKNWYGHEATPAEFDLCQKAHAWSVDWDLPIPEGIEEAYERATGKSCVYWGPDGDCNPHEETLPRSKDYVTQGYTEGFYAWLEGRIFEAVHERGMTDIDEINEYVRAV